MRKITLAITGASGMPFAFALIQSLNKMGVMVNLIISKAAVITLDYEHSLSLSANSDITQAKLVDYLQLIKPELLRVYAIQDWFAPMASGSSVDEAMVICPCSMATLSKVANGIGDDLITRSADVIIKERRNLIIVPRETPFSSIHLENMLKLSRIGVSIIPPIPAFYTKPQTIEDIISFVVSRILDQLQMDNNLIHRW